MEIVSIFAGYQVPRDSHIGKWQIECQKLDHDEWILPQFVEIIQEGWTVFDLGAFDGDHTLSYSQKVGDKGMVFAVEPGRVAFKCLEMNVVRFKNFNINLHSNISCWRAAISDKNSEYYEHIENTNLGASKIEKCDHAMHKDDFLSITIDDLSALRSPNFIKLDIEGFEVKALQGAEETLHKHRPIWAIEVCRGHLAQQGATPEQIRDILHSHNYEIRLFIPEKIDWATSPQFDIVAWPK